MLRACAQCPASKASKGCLLAAQLSSKVGSTDTAPPASSPPGSPAPGSDTPSFVTVVSPLACPFQHNWAVGRLWTDVADQLGGWSNYACCRRTKQPTHSTMDTIMESPERSP